MTLPWRMLRNHVGAAACVHRDDLAFIGMPVGGVPDSHGHRRTARSRSALPITLTEDSDIAAAAMTGDKSRPKIG
ncbi:hypothetical protein MMMDOFMJ_3309 [Methylobacterium gnaphalii]|uniref:Uncharacterized protein n=1 Tax=Methylobacterium gnaphalii TaxID=1010610 RepID=A0A512JFX8_9HYPH|nr:hypothetical protein MGN01_07000 [Methylobacterium gnaphalii]GJD70363.1 hypothetical protein MMMDOFMJ_3309 [Methylobacterium gnaphalii]GLS47620.1 hypothetical protein GCM10007885_04640 [Methylobacterium gnaphalii]